MAIDRDVLGFGHRAALAPQASKPGEARAKFSVARARGNAAVKGDRLTMRGTIDFRPGDIWAA
jgi:hypothetical protein